MENVDPGAPRTRQTAATDVLIFSKCLWLAFGASEVLLVRRFPLFSTSEIIEAKMAPRRPKDGSKTRQDAFETAPRRPQNAPRQPQDAPRRDHDGPRCPKTRPRCSQDAPKTPSGRKLRQVCASEAEEHKNIEKAMEKTCFFTASAQVDIILGGFLEASWNDLGRPLGYQDSA